MGRQGGAQSVLVFDVVPYDYAQNASMHSRWPRVPLATIRDISCDFVDWVCFGDGNLYERDTERDPENKGAPKPEDNDVNGSDGDVVPIAHDHRSRDDQSADTNRLPMGSPNSVFAFTAGAFGSGLAVCIGAPLTVVVAAGLATSVVAARLLFKGDD